MSTFPLSLSGHGGLVRTRGGFVSTGRILEIEGAVEELCAVKTLGSCEGTGPVSNGDLDATGSGVAG